MKTQVQRYHLPLNLMWMQANMGRSFLFAGICGCPKSVEGIGSIILNDSPRSQCRFCGRTVEMQQLLALDSRSRKYFELYKNEEGQFVTRSPVFASGTESPGASGASAVHPSS